MAVINWGVDFYTGLHEVDCQHQKLFALVNRLSAVPGDDPVALDEAFRELSDYAKEHFTLEERMMEEAGIDAEHFSYHKNAHALFIRKLTELWEARNDASANTTEKMLGFLTTWILQHILHTDRRMALEVHDKLGTNAPHNMFTHF